MLKYFETTALILLASVLLSVLWGAMVFSWTSRSGRVNRRPGDVSGDAAARGFSPQAAGRAGVISPALLVAPLLLGGTYHLVGWNLLFPVHFTSSFSDLALCALAPAFVLLLASGLLGTIARHIPAAYAAWSRKTFVLMTVSYGGQPRRALRRIVLLGALCRAWSQSLPGLFGELIVVECVFNAPGLGLDAWHEARVRHWSGLFEALFWLAGLYTAAVLLSALFATWLGRRLESYC